MSEASHLNWFNLLFSVRIDLKEFFHVFVISEDFVPNNLFNDLSIHSMNSRYLSTGNSQTRILRPLGQADIFTILPTEQAVQYTSATV